MAADILTILIKTNLAAAAAILLALALRKPARRAFGARIAYALWLVVPLGVGASLLPARAVVIPYVAPPQPLADVVASPTVTSAVTTPITARPLSTAPLSPPSGSRAPPSASPSSPGASRVSSGALGG